MSTLPFVPEISWDERGKMKVHANSWSSVLCPYCGIKDRAWRIAAHGQHCPVVLAEGRDYKLGEKLRLSQIRESLAQPNRPEEVKREQAFQKRTRAQVKRYYDARVAELAQQHKEQNA